MDSERYLRHLAEDGEAMAAAVEAHPQAEVPGCPGWDVAELVRHAGHVHRWAGETVRTRATERISRRDLPKPPADDAEVAAWFREGLASLLDALRVDAETPVWTWAAPPTVGFWQRRMAQETAVHRWDAESAAPSHAPAVIDAELAADGVDEVLDTFGFGRRDDEGRLELVATDIDRSWSIPLGEAGQRAAGRGPAGDLLLFLWGRIPPERLDVDHAGDGREGASLLTLWQEQVRI